MCARIYPIRKNAIKAEKAVFQGTGYHVHGLMWYDWLRSPRNNANNVAICWSNGTVNNANYNDTNGYVRPDLPCFLMLTVQPC